MPAPATDYVLQALRDEGLDHVFMVPGGLIDPFLPAFGRVSGLRPIVAAQEGGAAYMADGYARATGRFGACLVIGGPGITNTVTAVEAARTDGSPVMLISGQVPTNWEGRGGFQDSSPAALDDISILRPLCLSSYAVENPHLLGHHLGSCMRRMLAGPQGPVHLSLPRDIQTTMMESSWQPLDSFSRQARVVDEDAMQRVWDLLAPKEGTPPKKIAILAGAGVEKSGAWDELRQVAERYEIPVATTLRAKGVLPEDHHLSLGVFGYAGHRQAIETILSDEIEVLIVLGSGLLQRDTMFWNQRMLPQKALVRVDIDPSVIGGAYSGEVALPGDAGQVLRHLLAGNGGGANALDQGREERMQWLDRIRGLGSRYYEEENLHSEAAPIHPARVVHELAGVMPDDTVMVVDSGAHRAFWGHYWPSRRPRSYLSATNVGPMGWAIPAAVGAKAARPERPVVVATGDGCMLMHGMEIQTAARYGLAVVYVVINNSALANVWLRAHGEGPIPGELTSLPTHDWAGFARSLGLQAETVDKPGDLSGAFARAHEANCAYLLDVRCGKEFTTPVTPYSEAKKHWIDDC